MAKLLPFILPKPGNDRFSAIDPLDGRYYDAEVATYLSERSRIAYQAHVEAALAYTLADFGICTLSIAKKIEAASRQITAEEVYREEQTTKHDIKALINCIKQRLDSSAQPYVHFGATSYDIIATANVLQLRDAIQHIIIPRQKALLSTLIDLAEQHAETLQIGRTHGQHAVPITFGFAISEYVSRLGENLQAIEALATELVGKFSGAVGAYNALSVFINKPIDFEKALLAKLDLSSAPYSTQIIPPEGVIRLLDELTITAGIIANLAHDMRHLQRSEIAEVHEHFAKGQTGSSTMAHKRNPWNFENIVSMSKQVVAQSVNANLNLSSEHQRDLTDSASSRFYGITVASVASMLTRLNKVMKKIKVDESAMQHNLQLSGGAIAAEPFYLLLEKYGHNTAHEKAKQLAHEALDKGIDLVSLITSDKETAKYWAKFTKKEQQIVAHPEQYYTGLAAQKALSIAKMWRTKIKP